MGQIRVHLFTTIDGVVDAPMWTSEYGFTDAMGAAMGAICDPNGAILLGHETYEMFAPVWSTRTVDDDPGAPFFNDTPKYVVASTPLKAEWGNTTVLGGYDADRIRAWKDTVDGGIYVSGSATLVRAMIADGLVDELHLFVYPVAVGTGIRLFPEGTAQTPLTLAGCEAYDNGVVRLTYGPAGS